MLAAIVIDNLFAPNSQWATLNALCEGQETEKAVSVTLVYMTAGSAEEARAIGASLIGRRLAACVNILPGMFSQYHWQGSVQTDEEVVLIAKTRDELVDALTAHVREIHSYDCPCIVALPIRGGNPAFLQWIADETAAAPASKE